MTTKDLIVLVADKDAEFAVRSLLLRHQALDIRPISFDIYPQPDHDPGCRLRAHELLRLFTRSHQRAIVLFDREGCGAESKTRESIELDVEQLLCNSGWKDRCAAIVIEPELEAWIWSDSPHVELVLGWSGRNPSLRTWLLARQYLKQGQSKPERPKEAMRAALRAAQKPPSSSLFSELATKVSFSRCVDPAFIKFKSLLGNWFPSLPYQLDVSAIRH